MFPVGDVALEASDFVTADRNVVIDELAPPARRGTWLMRTAHPRLVQGCLGISGLSVAVHRGPPRTARIDLFAMPSRPATICEAM